MLPLPWRRQIGPTCGLAMLLAASEAVGCAERSSDAAAGAVASCPDGLFEFAAQRGFTRDGEMCSARWMAAVARHQGFDGACAVSLKPLEGAIGSRRHSSDGVALWQDCCQGAGAADGSAAGPEAMVDAAARVLSRGLARGHPVLFPVDRDPAGGDDGSGIGMLGGSGAHWVAVVGMWDDAGGASTVAVVDGIRRRPTAVPLRLVVASCAQLWHFGEAKLHKYNPVLHREPVFRPPFDGAGVLDLACQCVVLA